MITELTNCRVCKSKNLSVVLDLGLLYPSGFLKTDDILLEDSKVPLTLCKCGDCNLVQLKHTITLDLMYRQYWYSSSLNKSMVSSLRDIVIDIESKVNIQSGDVVVDIGCNDGTMLNMYPASSVKVGFDPALNLTKPNCNLFINDYFVADSYKFEFKKKAKVITAIAMFYDLPDPVKFVKDVASILDEGGIFIVQFTDLQSMFKATAFDNICHEHLEYYTLQDVTNILQLGGLEVIDVSYNDVNGGSIRVTASHRGDFPVANTVITSLKDESSYFQSNTLQDFNNRIDNIKAKMRLFLNWAKSQGKIVYILGASTKGNTFLQVCGITNKDTPYAAEVNKDKFGLRTAGTDIDIISEEDALIKHPDYFIVPVWHFKDSILKSKKIYDYINSNGRLMFPLPEFSVVAVGYGGDYVEARI